MIENLDPDVALELVQTVRWGGGLIVVGLFLWLAGDKVAAILCALAMFLPWNKGRGDGR